MCKGGELAYTSYCESSVFVLTELIAHVTKSNKFVAILLWKRKEDVLCLV